MTYTYILLDLFLIIGIFFLTNCSDNTYKEPITEKYDYVSFEKDRYSLYTTEGSYVVLLTKNKLDKEDAKFLIDYLDLSWFFYSSRAISKPRLNSHYNSKVLIAEV